MGPEISFNFGSRGCVWVVFFAFLDLDALNLFNCLVLLFVGDLVAAFSIVQSCRRDSALACNQRVNYLINRLFPKQIVHINTTLLSNSMSTVLSLLHYTWSPIELGKHHRAGCGQGDTLVGGHDRQ